jgi:hypothetical protein
MEFRWSSIALYRPPYHPPGNTGIITPAKICFLFLPVFAVCTEDTLAVGPFINLILEPSDGH